MNKFITIYLLSIMMIILSACKPNNVVPAAELAPNISSFIIPATATTLSVSGINISASDKVGITGYYLSESATAPTAGAKGWTTEAPILYLFPSAGTKTLYVWAKNAKGFISNASSAKVLINLTVADTTVPTLGTGINVSAITSSSLVLRWGASTDNITSSSALLYKVLKSTSNNLTNVTTAESLGTTVLNWTVNATTKPVTGLANGSTNYFAVLVKDAAGNKSLYSTVTANTLEGIAPILTAFTMPSTATELAVAVSSFTATDNVGVTGFCITETSTSNTCTWSATAPTYYTFTFGGAKTAYAFAKDAAGNISTSRSANITITMPDITPPTVGTPIAFSSITNSNITLTWGAATDNVTAASALLYKVYTSSANNMNSIVNAQNLGTLVMDWTANTLTKTAAVANDYSAIYFAVIVKDAAGNQALYPASSTTTLDGTAPLLTAFTMPAATNSQTIPVFTFTATDNVAVTGYCVTEVDSSANCQWTSSAPSTFTFSTGGLKMAYAWARDAANNVSFSSTAIVNVPNKAILEWDANPAEDNVKGYKLHYGVSPKNYTTTVDVGNVVTWAVENLTPGITYYFAVSAYNTSGIESLLSDEVNY